jgi:hypothetical protein
MTMETQPAPAPRPLSRIDLALLRAARAFGDPPRAGFWDVFPAERRASLTWAWEGASVGDATTARQRLEREHAAQARPDLARVHVSWWVRALQEEPRSVQSAVASRLSESLAEPLREQLRLTAVGLQVDRPSHGDAIATAIALWTARLVGDLEELEGDPPVIAALTRFDSRTVARFIRTAGLAKWSLTPTPAPELDAADLVRFGHFRDALRETDARFVQVAANDVSVSGPETPHPIERVGMIAFARQLNTADGYRARWALQHIPYATARSLRALMGPPGRRAPMLARWELEILRAAWLRLYAEGRITEPWGFGP